MLRSSHTDSRFGEAALGCIVLAAGVNTVSDDLVSFCRQKLGGYKIPRRFVFVPDSPRNATGKVLKRELRPSFEISRQLEVTRRMDPITHRERNPAARDSIKAS